MSYIELKDVKKIYKMGEVNINALSGVNFSVEKGEFVIIAGASGAGKSTILNILGGMDTPTSGEIIVDGCNISNYNSRQLTTYRRYDIGFVFIFIINISLPLYLLYRKWILIHSYTVNYTIFNFYDLISHRCKRKIMCYHHYCNATFSACIL